MGQTLTYSLLALEAASRDETGRAEKLALAQDAVRQALTQIRDISTNLRPGALTDLGLAASLHSLATRHAETTGITVRRQIEDVTGLGEEAELVCYRVAQEALTNVARHAQCCEVILTLRRLGKTVELSITDDGIGIGTAPEGTGRQGMRERANSVGAELRILSPTSGGSIVELTITIDEHEAE